jgi:16S rRNA (cytidine1402-2'-O)-methyltransferase
MEIGQTPGSKGKLYLIPTLLGETLPEMVLPAGTIQILLSLDILIVEQVRTARRLLSKIHIQRPIDEILFFELNKHTSPFEINSFLKPAFEGKSIGLLSEAGTPCVADPGAVVVELAHQSGIKVIPLTGPSSIILALMASGFNGQSFAFHGYLPIQANERERVIRNIEKTAITTSQTQIFIETPYRNMQLFEALVNHCHPDTLMCIAMNISLENEYIKSQTIEVWRKQAPQMHKIPAVFLIWSQQKRL